MIGKAMSARGGAILLLAAFVSTCATPTDATMRSHRVRLAFASNSVASSVPGPWVSIADSVFLTVTSGDGRSTAILRQELTRSSDSASFSVQVPAGRADFAARVVSTNGVALFSGSQTVDVSGSDVAVTIALAPIAPVLLVAPDTARQAVVNGKTAYTSVVVYNRGLDSLIWAVKDTLPPSSTSQCGTRGCLRLAPNRGSLGAGQSVTMIMTRQMSIPFTAPITFVIGSRAGDVNAVTLPF